MACPAWSAPDYGPMHAPAAAAAAATRSLHRTTHHAYMHTRIHLHLHLHSSRQLITSSAQLTPSSLSLSHPLRISHTRTSSRTLHYAAHPRRGAGRVRIHAGAGHMQAPAHIRIYVRDTCRRPRRVRGVCIHVYVHACMHMRVCMSVYAYTYVHACMCTYMHVCTRTCMYVYMHVRVHACTCIHVYAHACMHARVCTCVYACACVHVRVCMYCALCRRLNAAPPL
jgi:hypothetical protein